ncbi:hypothetical protein [Parasphingorhabdus sp.]|uniref:hypothetical protein n=1 Tax=Parasphingorhabdus sp. TaxID=2709688 RepID=UPI003A91D2A3
MQKAIIVPAAVLTAFTAGPALAINMVDTVAENTDLPFSRAQVDRAPQSLWRSRMLAALSNQNERRIPDRLEDPDCEQTKDCDPIVDSRTETDQEQDRVVDPSIEQQQQQRDKIVDPPEKTDQERDRRQDKPIEPGVA